ncbi:MAG: hypothetical protein KC729_10895, partial [Candidatus Eisenbacteria bacterium]|nr:hypothetical protein [Candidatus Eisenbacteria bacterium]
GGAIQCVGTSPTFSGMIFRQNVATRGAAVACLDAAHPSLFGCQFLENRPDYGGTVYCESGSSPTIEDGAFLGNDAFLGACIFLNVGCSPAVTRCLFMNNTGDIGVGIYMRNGSSPTVTECVFVENTTASAGDVVNIINSSAPMFTSCTFAQNDARSGSVVSVGFTSSPFFFNTIIAHSTGGAAFDCGTAPGVTIQCCDLYGNPGGDWTECIAGRLGLDGNFSDDPLFCNPSTSDYTLADNSPCAPGNNPECGLVGALGVGCASSCTIDLTPTRIVTYYPCDGSFPVDLEVNDVVDLASFTACAGFDPAHVGFDHVEIDPAFLGSTGRSVDPLVPVPCSPSCEAAGIEVGATTTGAQPGASGSGLLATLYWNRTTEAAASQDELCLDHWDFRNSTGEAIPVSFAPGVDLVHRSFCYGDFNDNGDVSILDIMQVAPRWGSSSGQPDYSELYDVNLIAPGNYCASVPDGVIDIVDVQSVASRWGQGCPTGAPLERPEVAQTTGSRAGTRLRIVPEVLALTGDVGESGVVSLEIEDAFPAGAFQVTLAFDPAIIQVESVEPGTFLEGTGRSVNPLAPQIDNENGTLTLGAWSIGDAPGAEGAGVLADVTFRIVSCPGETPLAIADAVLTDVSGWPIAIAATVSGTVTTECRVPTSSPEGSLPARFALLPSRPNPFDRSTVIGFSVPASADGAAVDLRIVDASGRSIRHLPHAVAGAGLHEVVWDGRDDGGTAVPSGIYFVRATLGETVFHRRMQLIR